MMVIVVMSFMRDARLVALVFGMRLVMRRRVLGMMRVIIQMNLMMSGRPTHMDMMR